MLKTGRGITKLYGAYHDPAARTPSDEQLRLLHQALDVAVLAAYGWDDVDLDHGFHETRYGLFFAPSDTARFELLMRLLELNHKLAERR